MKAERLQLLSTRYIIPVYMPQHRSIDAIFVVHSIRWNMILGKLHAPSTIDITATTKEEKEFLH